MRLLYVADGRSPIALNWIRYFVEQGHEVHLASTFPCSNDLQLASIEFVPVAFSSMKEGYQKEQCTAPEFKRLRGGLWGASSLRMRNSIRHWLGPLTLPQAAKNMGKIVSRVNPDLIHAMRLPYEGMLASMTKTKKPLLLSVWGNDFTLHAPSTPWMRHYTRLALIRADALHIDCQRDQRLALSWGFSKDKPTVVLPGAGGVQPGIFFPPTKFNGTSDIGLDDKNSPGVAPDVSSCISFQDQRNNRLNERNLTVINPRGFRAYVRNDTFFKAIPLVLERHPQTRFICPAMVHEPEAWRWIEKLGIVSSVELLPVLTRQQMADRFRQSRVMVSAATHDGTPNTLLEAMACGCLPVAGDIESLREWIQSGHNGLLFDPGDPQDLANRILLGLEDEDLCRRASIQNIRLITEKACYPTVMSEAEIFYRSVLQSR